MDARGTTTEVIDDDMAEVMRRKTGAQRLAIVDALYRSAWAPIEGNVRAAHPDWGDARVRAALAGRVAGGAD
jgi:hypothetical protein